MLYFFDTEFIEDGKTIDLLSIGIVSEDNRALYMRNGDADFSKADKWVVDNVFPTLGVDSLGNKDGIWFTRDSIKENLLEFIGTKVKPEFWAYYADYDWVVFCQLFGRMVDLPKPWPMYCNDLKQLCKQLGNPKLPKNEKEHHALADAMWVKQQYASLMCL